MEVVILSIATVMLALCILVASLSSLPNADQFGFLDTTAEVFNGSQRTQIFLLDGHLQYAWGVIFPWQIILMLYAWSFVFRPSTPRTISWIALLLYTGTNVSGTIWAYVFNNGYLGISFPFLFMMIVGVHGGCYIAVETVHLYKLTPRLLKECKYKIDLWITRMLVVNGMCIYATWLTVANMVQFASIIQYDAGADGVTAGSISLWILSVIVLSYFALENTVLDRFTRFIYIIYPVLIWSLIGVVAENWGQYEVIINPLISLFLLVLAIILLVARIIMVTLFAKYRPLPYCRSIPIPIAIKNQRRYHCRTAALSDSITYSYDYFPDFSSYF